MERPHQSAPPAVASGAHVFTASPRLPRAGLNPAILVTDFHDSTHGFHAGNLVVGKDPEEAAITATPAELAALRKIRDGYTDLIIARQYGHSPRPKVDEEGALRCFDVPPAEGLNRAQASKVMLDHGYAKGSRFATFVRQGWVARDGDRRYLTELGRARLIFMESGRLARHDG
jgi:hypothetical protein